jgi:hypothetical protein
MRLDDDGLAAYDRGIAAASLGEMAVYGKINDSKTLQNVTNALALATHSTAGTIRVRAWGAIRMLIRALAARLTKDADDFQRAGAAHLLRTIWDKSAKPADPLQRAVPSLVSALSDPDAKVRKKAAEALKAISPADAKKARD